MHQCPYCKKTLRKDFLKRAAASIVGSTITEAKSRASRLNGQLGGRPPLPKPPKTAKRRGRPPGSTKVQPVSQN